MDDQRSSALGSSGNYEHNIYMLNTKKQDLIRMSAGNKGSRDVLVALSHAQNKDKNDNYVHKNVF